MAAILNWIMESIRSYGAWSVFIGVIIESVIVPIPSPLIIMGAGFVLISPQLSFFEALVPILLTDRSTGIRRLNAWRLYRLWHRLLRRQNCGRSMEGISWI